MADANKCAHTPGPWEVSDDCIEIFIRDNDGYPIIIAEVFDGGDCADEPQLRADARLIAAAPDLLEALKACSLELSYCRDQLAALGRASSPGGSVSRALASARAALAKAKGAA